MKPPKTTIPHGFCHCGCGEKTNLAPYNRKSKGWVKGTPLKCIYGHSRRSVYRHPKQPKKYKLLAMPCGSHVIVSNGDFARAMEWRWHLNNNGYAVSTLRRKQGLTAYLHRFLLDAPKGVEVDHINRNPLDNRRENLRLCTHSQNGANKAPVKSKSGYKNVYQSYPTRWQVKAKIRGKIVYFGSFRSLQEAVVKSNEVLSELHGEFAVLNSLEAFAK